MKHLLSAAFIIISLFTTAQSLTIEEAVLGRWNEFAPEDLRGLQWVEGCDLYSYIEQESLNIVNTRGKVINSMTLDQLNLASNLDLKSFPSVTFIDSKSFRFSSNAHWYIADLKTKKISKWQSIPNGENIELSSSKVISYTRENNVFIQKDGAEIQVTDLPDGVIAGQAIARYEFGISKGLFWAPNAQFLAFYQKDERRITAYPLTNLTRHPAELTELKYPMAGQQSELESCGIYDLRSGKTVYLAINSGEIDDTYYITNLAWTPDASGVIVAIVNRAQDEMILARYNPYTGEREQVIFTENDEKYIEPESPVSFIPNGNGDFLWFSERDGFNNLYRYSSEGKLRGKTNATFPMTDILGYDTKGSVVFVNAHGPNPTESHVYKVNLSDMSMQKLTRHAGTHRAMLSSSGTFLLDRWSSVDTPNRIDLLTASGKEGSTLVNAADPLANRIIGNTELLTIKANDGTDLWCRMITPKTLEKGTQYPVLVYVYNGPHVQLVTNSFLAGAPLWMHHLAAEGYIVFTVDGRGSAHRGRDFEQAIFRQLGTLEMADQLAGVNYLKTLPYVDADRMAVHGWSFGGFMTTSLMLRQPGVFKVGVAGGPVIDWSLYEVMYTERYMDKPQENPEGFETSKLTNYVTQLEGDLLMIHGSIDDVVLMQHNYDFLKACIDEGVQVDFFVYPNHPHNVRGKDRVHLMTKVIQYITERL